MLPNAVGKTRRPGPAVCPGRLGIGQMCLAVRVDLAVGVDEISGRVEAVLRILLDKIEHDMDLAARRPTGERFERAGGEFGAGGRVLGNHVRAEQELFRQHDEIRVVAMPGMVRIFERQLERTFRTVRERDLHDAGAGRDFVWPNALLQHRR